MCPYRNTIIEYLDSQKVTVQPALHMGPMPMSVSQKAGMMWPVWGKSLGKFGIRLVAVAKDCCRCPVAVPTVTFGAEGSTLLTGASGA